VREAVATMRKKRVLPSLLGLRSPGGALRLWLLAAGLALPSCGKGVAPPPVECVVDYGGEAHSVIVHPTLDPYRVSPLGLEDTFEFKAVYVARPAPEATLDFYVYYLTPRGPVIAEQTKYRPPFPRNSPTLNGNFTGAHHVYGPDGEELVYSCRWRSQ
jgi:hypothetical protein